MTGLRQRIDPIRSRKLLNSARGAPCTLEFPGICNHNPETTVAAHIKDEQFGRGQKADDTSSVHACSSCHRFLDEGWAGRMELGTLRFYIIRALQRTLRNRIERGLIVVPMDPVARIGERPVKPRKPPEQRAAIKSRGFDKTMTRRMSGEVAPRNSEPDHDHP